MTVSDDVTITVNPVADRRNGNRARRRVLQRSQQRLAFRHARPRQTGSDRQLRLGVGRAGHGRVGRQLLGAVDRTGPGACERQLHLHDIGRRRRSPLGQRAAAHRQLGRSGCDDEDERAGRARRRGRATTSRWSTTSTAGWRRRSCCGRIRDRRRWRSRRSQLYPPANRAPVANAGADQTITLPATASLTGTATDDGLPSPPATAVNHLEPREWSGHGDVFEPGHAEHDGDLLGRGHLRAPSDRLRQRSHVDRRRHGRRDAGGGQRPDGAVLQRPRKRHALRDARPHARGSRR